MGWHTTNNHPKKNQPFLAEEVEGKQLVVTISKHKFPTMFESETLKYATTAEEKIKSALPQVLVTARKIAEVGSLAFSNKEWLQTPKVKKALEECFLVAVLGEKEQAFAAWVMSQVHAGLNADIKVKLSHLSTENAEVRGSVHEYSRADHAKLAEGSDKAKAEQLQGHLTGKGKIYFSNIKLDLKVFIRDMSKTDDNLARTLVHEATHRFAGTEDHAYMEEGGATFRKEITAEKCMFNADSYAWFSLRAYLAKVTQS